MEDPRVELGRKVEIARLARGWSKERAAREADISSITWKKVEDGLSVQDVKRFAVLKALGLNATGDPESGPSRYAERLSAIRRGGLSEERERQLIRELAAELEAEERTSVREQDATTA